MGVLKIPAVRDYFKIERAIEHPVELLPKKKGFVAGFKDCKFEIVLKTNGSNEN